MINAATPYRRDRSQAVRVPVVMPSVEVRVDQQGYLTITLDREPYSADGALRRDDLKHALDEIAADLGTPVRVAVREADDSVFTDILTPSHAVSEATPPGKKTLGAAFEISTVGISGQGFAAGEQVEVCIVVARRVADDHGTARLRLPPALLADHPDVLLVGRTSGAVALNGGAA